MEVYKEIEDQGQKSYFDKMGDNGKGIRTKSPWTKPPQTKSPGQNPPGQNPP